MSQSYPRTEREKEAFILRTALERHSARHQETLERLRLLALLV